MAKLSLSGLLGRAAVLATLLAAAAPVRAQFASLGKPANEALAGEPSCLSWPQANTRVQCYVRGASGTLWQVRSQDSVVFDGGWRPLGGALASDPVCVSPSLQRVECFATFTDGALWRTTSVDAGQTFSAWITMRAGTSSVSLEGKPSCVASTIPSGVNCFAVGADRKIHRLLVAGSSVSRSVVGSSTFSLQVLPGSTSALGPICVSAPPAPGTSQTGARCFARRPDGSFWTVQIDASQPLDSRKTWTEIPLLRGRVSTLDCFSWPGGRIDCFGSKGSQAVHHLSNVPVPPPTGRAQPEQSGGFFHTEQAAPPHPFPVRCRPSATSAAINCIVAAWRDGAISAGPLQMQRLRFNEEPSREPDDLGGDLRSTPSCVLVAEGPPAAAALATVDTACFALASDGSLVYRRLDPPPPPARIPALAPPDSLTPGTPLEPPR